MDIPPGLMITVTDAKHVGYCPRGMKTFAAAYGLDFRAFLTTGIPADKLLSTGDAFAQRVIAAKLSGRS